MGEALGVARAIGLHHGFADAFRPGQGPTAHLTPAEPWIAGMTFMAFGYQSTLSGSVLTIWVLFLVFSAFWLQMRTFQSLGLSKTSLFAALGFLCLVPLNFSLEVMTFRVWEGALATALASSLLFLLSDWDGKEVTPLRVCILAGVLSLLLFVSPAVGLAGVVANAVFIARNTPFRKWPIYIVIAATIGIAILLPWTIRNEAVFGRLIPLRSNAGLELAVAFRPYAVTHTAEDNFKNAMATIHPRVSDDAFAAMRRSGGEVQYSNRLGADAVAWIFAHPFWAIRLAADHLAGMFFPAEWYWAAWSESGSATTLKRWLNWFVSVFGLLGMVIACGRGDRRLLYPLIIVVITALSYIMVQPILRYRYVIFGLLVYFAALFLDAMAARLPERYFRFLRSNPKPPVPTENPAQGRAF